MRVQLIKKLAEMLDGIDVSAHQQGDILNLTRSECALLVAEGWAVRESGVGAVERGKLNSSLALPTKVTLAVRAADRARAARRVKSRAR